MKYILLIVALLSWNDFVQANKPFTSYDYCEEEPFDPSLLQGESAVRYVFENSELKHLTEYVVAQAKFESYNFKSNHAINDHNFVGMGVAYQRPQNRVGINRRGEKGRPTAIFASDYECALDLLRWYQWHENHFCEVNSVSEFTLKLKQKAYFGASVKRYRNGIERWLEDQPVMAYWLEDIS